MVKKINFIEAIKNKPKVAMILLVLGGIIILLIGVDIVLLGSVFGSTFNLGANYNVVYPNGTINLSEYNALMQMQTPTSITGGIIRIILGVLIILSGIMVYKRSSKAQSWGRFGVVLSFISIIAGSGNLGLLIPAVGATLGLLGGITAMWIKLK